LPVGQPGFAASRQASSCGLLKCRQRQAVHCCGSIRARQLCPLLE
jgi:hypothetical protein